MNNNTDKGLQGNEKIEEAIAGLQKETTQEMLAHTLTVIRRCMKADGPVHHCCGTTKGRWTDPTGSDQNRGWKKLVGSIYQF